MLGNRYAQHSFSMVPDARIARSNFDRSFATKDTMNFDDLVPIFVDEILPGDTANVTVNMFARLSTPKVPIMDNLMIDYFFFFVPTRLVWSNWEKFNGAQDNPGDSTSYVIPTLTTTGLTFDVDTIFDKYGLPTGITAIPNVNALPLRCYNLIWNTWFRDQNMQNSLTVPTGDGPDTLSTYTLKKRGKRHDYFTSALPWPQKGTAVSMPLSGTAPVLGLAFGTAVAYTGAATGYKDAAGSNPPSGTNWGGSTWTGLVQGDNTSKVPNIRADLSLATSATINQFRQAIMVQSLLELDARGGTRYVEILQAHWNVISPDFRLQRPEYLGGGQVKINCHPVAQTSPTSGSNAQGQLAAFGTASTQGRNVGFTKSFVEHGYVIGLASARSELTYQQGLDRMWSRSTRYDFFWPKLQEMGEQSILNKELYCKADANDNLVFGYQERYAEYRYKPSQIKGQFRSTYATSLDVWHMAQNFGALPTLGDTFIQSSTPISRSVAVASAGAYLLVDTFFSYKHARAIMTYGVPASLGRF